VASSGKDNLRSINTGIPSLEDACVVVISTEWNHDITGNLKEACIHTLKEQGLSNIQSLEVPGAFELPFAVQAYWRQTNGTQEQPHAFIVLGCVIRGDTPHFDYVCKAVTDGILQLNLQLSVPVIFGVLTVNNRQQALDRCQPNGEHKGREAALTAIKMMAFQRSL
jgi:6,7-dimethyl-8-ribityllumazine synthase